MAVREATVEDIPHIFNFGQKMLNRMYGFKQVEVDRGNGYRDMRMLVSSKTGLVLIDEDATGKLLGVLAGQVMKQAFVDLRYATDLAFFVEENKPITAIKLVRRFVHWAQQQQNVREVVINVTHGLGDVDRMKIMYEKLGMTHLGGSFGLRFGDLARPQEVAA